MRVFRVSYKDKSGNKQQASKWYMDFTDHKGIRHRWPGFEDNRQTDSLGRQIERLVKYKMAGEMPDVKLCRWLENLPKRYLKLLVSIGLLGPHKATAGKLLTEHLDDFHKSLLAKGDTPKQAKQVTTRARKVISGCRFRTWMDISASKVENYLAELRNNGQGISIQTSNFYLQAIKQFCKWMVSDRRATDSPLEHLKGLNVRTDRRHDRRALEPDEIRRLLEATRAAPERFGMSGYQRALLYQLAVETGLRATELRSLKASSFNFDGFTVTIEAGYSKHRRQDVLPVRLDTAAELKLFLAGKLPGVRVFNMPVGKTSKMFRADLAAAGIDYIDATGRYADFHALRHTTGSLLAASGAHPKTAQSLMRHSDINLTMSRYTHIFRGQESEAVANLPDLSLPSNQAQANKKTGTDNADVTEGNSFATSLAKLSGESRTTLDYTGQIEPIVAISKQGQESGIVGPKTGFSGQKRRGGDSNPRCGCIPTRRFSKPLP